MFSLSVRQRNKMLSLKSHYLACVLECVKNTDVKLHGCKFECVWRRKSMSLHLDLFLLLFSL